MKINEFLEFFDFSNLRKWHIIIFPIEENKIYMIRDPKNCSIDFNRKIKLDDFNDGFIEDYEYFVDSFKIKAKRQSDKRYTAEYELIDFEEIDDNFYFIVDKNNKGWIVYEFNW